MKHKVHFATIIFTLFLLTVTPLLNSGSLHKHQLYASSFIMGELTDVTLPYENNTTNFSHFSLKNETEFLFTSSTQNNVTIWNETQNTTFGEFGGNPQNFVTPTLINSLPNGSIFVYDNLRRLKLFSENGTFVNNFNLIFTGSTYLPLGKVSSIASDLKNNLYALDYDNNLVLKKSAQDNEMKLLLNATSLNITLTEHSQIVVSPNSELIFLKNINNGTNIYYLQNLTSFTQINLQANNILNASEIAIDCANNLFVLEKNPTTSMLHKFSRNTYQYETFLYVTNNELNNIKNLQINIETGSMFAINTLTNTLQSIELIGEEVFTEDIYSFVHPINYLNLAPLLEVAVVKTTNDATPLLQTPYNITPIITLEPQTKVIILSETVTNNADFAYVMHVNASTKENITGYVLKQYLTILETTPSSYSKVRILNNNTNLYKYPTTLNTQLVVGSINKGEELSIIDTSYNIEDANDQNFYAVRVSQTEIAYVRVMDVVPVEIAVTTPTLFTNAEITITDNSSFINIYEDELGTLLLPHTLNLGKRIYIEAYNTSLPYTKITFLNENNEEVEGYIETKYIKVYGDYNNLLQAFLLTSVSGVLIIALLLIKTRKKQEE